MTTPYTYRVTHISSGKWYYGVRYAEDCHPDDLWKDYYTSSEVVKALIQEEGAETFVTEIRKVFPDPTSAIIWELRVLRRVIYWEVCLNERAFPAVTVEARARGNAKKREVQSNGKTIAQEAGEKWRIKQHTIDPVTGLTFKELRRQRYNVALDKNGTRTRSDDYKAWFSENNPSKRQDVKDKIQSTLKAQVKAGTFPTTKGRKFPSISQKLTGNKHTADLIWVNDGVSDFRLNPSDDKIPLLQIGRLKTNNKGHKYELVSCPHCGKVGGGGGMIRYHFDACKIRQI